jgi:hypothetical protein
VLGLGSYRTAWNLLHKLRRAFAPGATGCKVLSKSMRFSSAGRDQASEGAGRRAQGKVSVVIAAQQAAKGIGRIRLTRVADASAGSLRRRSPPPSNSAATSAAHLDYYLDEYTFRFQSPNIGVAWPAILAAHAASRRS